MPGTGPLVASGNELKVTGRFGTLEIHPDIARAIDELGFMAPTPVQQRWGSSDTRMRSRSTAASHTDRRNAP
jgi:hypothetical protein